MLNKKGMRFVVFTAQNLRINPQLPLHSVHRRWLLHKHSRLIIIRTYCEFVLGSCGFKFAHFSSHAQSSGIANNNRPIRSISYTNARKSAYKIKTTTTKSYTQLPGCTRMGCKQNCSIGRSSHVARRPLALSLHPHCPRLVLAVAVGTDRPSNTAFIQLLIRSQIFDRFALFSQFITSIR